MLTPSKPSRSQGGVKTLADFADQKLEQMLASVGDAMTVTRSCEALMPLADELGIVKRCVDAVAGAIVEKIGAGGKDQSPG